ncbi:histidine protein methyltransferase 1 homolog [Harmonia axyridis]|uniref:histidine protein methyltransferase 1 homolog n=1 Tax=Harmonia axyridis TaxID=115357 RepID=UPI001E27548F|nr:histidine protein methyltransferase 1 homolog [Harmonia axyridis]XP_045474848.1 histidine protein methyltransferase 1 homolog [Harmonia axyridis]XP_045474849.1 histidine protein methyltransferase 1 homolog [Harmonia axyridis]
MSSDELEIKKQKLTCDHSVDSKSKETKQDSMVELKFDELERIQQQLSSFWKYEPIRKSVDLRTLNVPVKQIVEVLEKNDLKCERIKKAEQSQSDLISSVYEGGARTWECTYDLLNYIENEKMYFRDKKVLDLGCGTGLVGIMCLSRRATCHFQDFNDEVLKYITFPNVKENVYYFPENNFTSCKFLCGDWIVFSNFWLENYPKEKFDYIFTSETIYKEDNYHKLHSVFEDLLSPQGKIYLAAKTFYFGPGGGLYTFLEFLNNRKKFEYKLVWQYINGLTREIYEIKFK